MIVFLLLLLGAVMNDTSARDVISFNTGWQFKKGPFSTDPMRASAQWDGKWEEVTIPHTWNAKDMQVKADAFYEGVGYYRKKQFLRKNLHVFIREDLKVVITRRYRLVTRASMKSNLQC